MKIFNYLAQVRNWYDDQVNEGRKMIFSALTTIIPTKIDDVIFNDIIQPISQRIHSVTKDYRNFVGKQFDKALDKAIDKGINILKGNSQRRKSNPSTYDKYMWEQMQNDTSLLHSELRNNKSLYNAFFELKNSLKFGHLSDQQILKEIEKRGGFNK